MKSNVVISIVILGVVVVMGLLLLNTEYQVDETPSVPSDMATEEMSRESGQAVTDEITDIEETTPSSVSSSETTDIPVTSIETNPPTTPEPIEDDGIYSIAEVAMHDDRESCWMIIRGDVYDFTSYIDDHPGGSETILINCGTFGTAMFEEEHGGKYKIERQLENYKIGVLEL